MQLTRNSQGYALWENYHMSKPDDDVDDDNDDNYDDAELIWVD